MVGDKAITILGFATDSVSFAVGADAGISVWRVVATLIFCLLLGLGAIFALRSRLSIFTVTSLGKTKRLLLTEQIALGPHRSACIIAVDGAEYLAVLSPSAVQILALPVSQIVDGV
jgi:flagellar biogenesis protein FliO